MKLLSAFIRHERRARLSFDTPPAARAFTEPSLYMVDAPGAASSAPRVVRAFAVGGLPSTVEVHLDEDLVQGQLYGFSAVGVPAADGTISDAASRVEAAVPVETRDTDLATRGAPSAIELALFGSDLVRAGGDFAEDPGGDLRLEGGIAVARRDVRARLLSDGLPWDDGYGLKPREFIDGPDGLVPALRGRAEDEARRDDRVVGAVARVESPTPETVVLVVAPTFVGAGNARASAPIEVRIDR